MFAVKNLFDPSVSGLRAVNVLGSPGGRMPKLCQFKALVLELYLLSKELGPDDLLLAHGVLVRPPRRSSLKVVDKSRNKPKLFLVQGGKARLNVED